MTGQKTEDGSVGFRISDFGFGSAELAFGSVRIDSNQSWRGFSEAQSVTKLEEISDFGLRSSDF